VRGVGSSTLLSSAHCVTGSPLWADLPGLLSMKLLASSPPTPSSAPHYEAAGPLIVLDNHRSMTCPITPGLQAAPGQQRLTSPRRTLPLQAPPPPP
jgi:hypothetical protein